MVVFISDERVSVCEWMSDVCVCEVEACGLCWKVKVLPLCLLEYACHPSCVCFYFMLKCDEECVQMNIADCVHQLSECAS